MVWNFDTITFLEDNYLFLTYEELAKEIGTSKSSVERKAKELKLGPKRNLWTKEDIELLHELYPYYPSEQLEVTFDRFRDEITHKAFEYGLKKKPNMYKVYRHNKLIATGTIRQIAEKLGLEVQTVYGWRYNKSSYKVIQMFGDELRDATC